MSNSGSAVEQDGKLKLGRSEWRGCVVKGIVFAVRKIFRLSSVLFVRSEALRPATFELQRSVYSADVSVASRICSIYSVATAIIPWDSLIVILWSDVGMFVVMNG